MIQYFVRHQTAANLLMLILILAGLIGAISLRRDVFPEFASDSVNIQVVYKGASAEEVEETVCQPIEERIEGIEGIEEVVSAARESLAIFAIEVADGYEAEAVLRDVENAVDRIDTFPENVEEPILWEMKQISPVCTVTIWGENGAVSGKHLLALAENIQDDILALDEVSQANLTGVSDHQIRVEVIEEALLAHGLTVSMIAQEIAAQSLDLPVGSLETSEREIKFRMVDQRRRADDFRNLTIQVSPAGARIPLGNIARVTDTFEDDWTLSSFHGSPCINLDIQKTDQEDTISVAESIDRYVASKQSVLPEGVRLTMWGDYSIYVKDRLWMLVENGCWGFLLVFLTLWMLLNFRLSFWVALGIPLSFLGTLWVMDYSGMTLNMITMFALIMAVGIIVDDAIVIGENIFTHHSRGKPPAEAAIDGTHEVALGVVAAMLTTIAVFMPLFQMQGDIGKIMRVMPLGVVTALAVSLIEAFFILPNHLAHSLTKNPREPNRIRAAIDRFVLRFTERVYGPILDWAVRHPFVPVAGAITLFLLSLGMLRSGRLPFQLFPELDGDFLVAQVEMPQGTDIEHTRRIIARVENGLNAVEAEFNDRQPHGEKLIRHVSTSFGYVRVFDAGPIGPETGKHVAQVLVELLAADRRDAACDEVLKTWSDAVGKVPDVVELSFQQMQVTPGGKPIGVQLRGENLDELKRASLDLQNKISTYPGIRNLTDNLRSGKEEFLIQLKPEGRPLGITSAALASQIRAAFWGTVAEEFQHGTNSFEVKVQFAAEDRNSPADLEEFKVRTPEGLSVPFPEVATYQRVRGFSQIMRVDRRRSISVSSDLDTSQGNAKEILADLEKNFFDTFLEEHPGVSIYLEGQRKEEAKTKASLLRGFLIGLAMIFILLSFVFRSFIEPLIVMVAIPFGLIGAIAGHLLLGLDWTMPSSIGFISLSGIVVNDSIVLVSFIKLRLKEGLDVPSAVHRAGIQRFRPVFLTSATTVAGLLPMMMETSLQAQFLIPMAVSIAFGLLFATVLVLLLVPCEYAILSRLGWAQKIEMS